MVTDFVPHAFWLTLNCWQKNGIKHLSGYLSHEKLIFITSGLQRRDVLLSLIVLDLTGYSGYHYLAYEVPFSISQYFFGLHSEVNEGQAHRFFMLEFSRQILLDFLQS